MNKNIEDRIKALESTIMRIKEVEKEKRYSQYGDRIIECIKAGDYSEAGFVTECFKVATTQFPIRISENGKVLLGNYIDATVALINFNLIATTNVMPLKADQ